MDVGCGRRRVGKRGLSLGVGGGRLGVRIWDLTPSVGLLVVKVVLMRRVRIAVVVVLVVGWVAGRVVVDVHLRLSSTD